MAIKKKSTPEGSIKRIIPDTREPDLPMSSVEGEKTPEGQLSVDVFQTPEEIVIVAPLAGVRLKDISVSVNESVLTVRGQRSVKFAVTPENYFTQECFWGNFSRSIILPDSVDTEKIKASFRDGILTVRIPKVERVKMRTISIQTD